MEARIQEDLDMEMMKIGISITTFNIASFTYPEEIQKMADAYKMEADKIREAIGESGLEQMKKDMAVQKAVTVIADAAVEVEKAADAE